MMKFDELVRDDGTTILVEGVENGSGVLCAILSGYNYNQRNPLLHYSKEVFHKRKFDCLSFDLEYYRNKRFQSLDEGAQRAYFEEDCQTIVQTLVRLLEQRGYARLILMGKSLGTSVIRRCLRVSRIVERSVLILLTPGSEWNDSIPEFNALDNPLLVIGSLGDELYPVDNLEALRRRKNLSLLELKAGNHSLEVGEVHKDLEIVATVVQALESFLTSCGL